MKSINKLPFLMLIASTILLSCNNTRQDIIDATKYVKENYKLTTTPKPTGGSLSWKFIDENEYRVNTIIEVNIYLFLENPPITINKEGNKEKVKEIVLKYDAGHYFLNANKFEERISDYGTLDKQYTTFSINEKGLKAVSLIKQKVSTVTYTYQWDKVGALISYETLTETGNVSYSTIYEINY